MPVPCATVEDRKGHDIPLGASTTCYGAAIMGRAGVALDDQVLTSDEAAAYLRVSVKTLLRLVHRGELPGTKVGRSWRFHRADLESLVKQGSRR